jgi:hypothetical protein
MNRTPSHRYSWPVDRFQRYIAVPEDSSVVAIVQAFQSLPPVGVGVSSPTGMRYAPTPLTFG